MLAEFVGHLKYWIGTLSLVLGLMTILEILWGRDQLTVRERLKGLPFWAVQIIVRAATAALVIGLTQRAGIKPFFKPFEVGPIIGSLILVLVYDLAFYCFHRLQHRYLWPWHAPHHSFKNLTAINSHHHWTDPILSTAIMSFPLSLIEWPGNSLPAILAGLMTLQTYAIHSNLKFDMGPFQRLLVGPAYHRIHHSLIPEHRDKNFGAFIPLWDWLFGTLVWPTKVRPPVGVADFPEPSFKEWWLAPIRTKQTVRQDEGRAALVRALRSSQVN